MRIRRVELTNFKRFTHLIVEGIPQTAKLIILVGPNGSGKTSFMESMNHYYKYLGYNDAGDYHYLSKEGSDPEFKSADWRRKATKLVDIDFYDVAYSKNVGNSAIKGHFYFRSAYRNEPSFQVQSMTKQDDPTKSVRLATLIQDDKTVSANYQRLIANTISGVYDDSNNAKSVLELREELTGKIRDAMTRVFEDLVFSSLGDPLNNGNFYFTKGAVKDFQYRNLSAGEKSAFDLILDMVMQSKYYPDAIYCIDEPEAHMHTKLQGKVLHELHQLVPGSSQLWISTHSIGMLQEAEEIEKKNPGTVVFLDFSDRDFDEDQIMRPAKISRAVQEKFYELAFGDFAKLILPKTIIFCEGDPNGKARKDFDKTIYTIIFGDTHPDAFFISGGSCNEIEVIEQKFGEVMSVLLGNSNIIKVVDRDDRSDKEVSDLLARKIKTLSRRHLEAYLLDDEVIRKLCDYQGQADKATECIDAKKAAIANSVSQGKPSDDIKSARGEIYVGIKRILCLQHCGNTADSFIRDTLAPLVTPDMNVYKELENDIFGGGNP